MHFLDRMELTPTSLSKYPLSLLLAKGKQDKGVEPMRVLTPPSPEVRDQSTGFRSLSAMDGEQIFGEKVRAGEK